MENTFDEKKNLEFIEEFEKSEAGQYSFLKSESRIISSEELANDYKRKINSKKSITFSPNTNSTILTILFSILFLVPIFSNFQKDGFKNELIYILGFLYVAFMYIIFEKKKNFRIHISELGLTIRSRTYEWNEIKKKYFIQRPENKGHSVFINIVLGNGFNDKEDLSNIVGFFLSENKIAAYLEHYRQSSNTERKSP